MQLNIFLFAILIILSFSLKETLPIYKAMTELKPALQKEACLFKKDNEELYMQPCQEGFHCGNKQKDISTCIPNYFGQKVGEACNYDDECIYGECDEKRKNAYIKREFMMNYLILIDVQEDLFMITKMINVLKTIF